jgi:hypothetical protein
VLIDPIQPIQAHSWLGTHTLDESEVLETTWPPSPPWRPEMTDIQYQDMEKLRATPDYASISREIFIANSAPNFCAHTLRREKLGNQGQRVQWRDLSTTPHNLDRPPSASECAKYPEGLANCC